MRYVRHVCAACRSRALLTCGTGTAESGNKHRETIQAGDKFEKHWVTPVSVIFLYSDESHAYFQNPETFEQLDVPVHLVGSQMLSYLSDGQEATVVCNDSGEPLMFQAPPRVQCQVHAMSPSFKLVNVRDLVRCCAARRASRQPRNWHSV